MSLKSISTCLLFSLVFTCYSQKYPFKFGKVSDEEMEMKSCSFYPEANSMIIAEYGDLNFIYNNEKGWQYRMEVAVRKKIFKITDADQANVKIRIYEPAKSRNKETISYLKSYTHNYVDGKIKREKLDSKEYFTKRLNDYWVEISFAIPNIKEGTVVEYTYIKTSDYINNLSTWYFQSDIPTAISQFQYTIPEYFNYQVVQLGNVYFGESDSGNKKETFRYRYRNVGVGGQIDEGTGSVELTSKWNRLILKNIPPIEEEPHMTNKSDIPSRLTFQLESTNFPNSTLEVVAGNYEKFNDQLLSSSVFGDRLNKGNFIKEIEGKTTGLESFELASVVYDHIKNHFAWNESYTFTSDEAGRPAYNKKEGNVADINLSLIAAYREVGLQAYPIILSTRGSGTVHPIYPSYEDFNYVIAALVIKDQVYFCDATTRLSLGELPMRCRNGRGWMVLEGGGQWINMKTNSDYGKTMMLATTITEDSIITKVSQKDIGYAAYNTLVKTNKLTKKELAEEISSKYDDAVITQLDYKDGSQSSGVVSNYNILREINGTDILYLQPVLDGTVKENPFKRESRLSIVDFPYTQSYKVISTIEIPEGYSAELPESALIRLPENKGSFLYNITQNGNTISVVSDLKINETVFSITEYPNLKTFYQMVADKNQELIVLKR